MDWLPFAVILALIAINAFYVAAEFSTIGLRPTLVAAEADKGSAPARALQPFVTDSQRLDAYIAACQIGITWSSLVLGAFGQAAFGGSLAPLLQSGIGMQPALALTVSAIVVLVVLTGFQMVFGELIPKSLALHNPLGISLLTIWPMRVSLKLYTWPIRLLNGSGWFLLRMFGQSPESHRHIHSPEEISMLMAKSKDGGLLEAGEVKRLQGALRIGRRTVRQLMTPRLRMRTIEVSTPPEELLDLVSHSPFTRLPVHQGTTDRIIGVLYARDLAARTLEGDRLPPVREMMRPAFFVVENLTADRLLLFFRKHATRFALVVNEYGAVAGLVTLDDVLSEVLGDMPDEFKAVATEAEKLPDGRIRLSGILPLDEAREWTGTAWKSEADTVAGAVLEAAGRIPAGGDLLLLEGGLEIEVEVMEGNRVESVLVRRIPQPEPGVAV